jgi:uncharacterized protein YggE
MLRNRQGIAVFLAAMTVGGVTRGDGTPTITVIGTAKVEAVVDLAEVQVGVITEAVTAKAALEESDKATTALHAILKENGIAEKNIQTTRIRVQPLYERAESRPEQPPNESSPPKCSGYCVENTILVRTGQIEKLGTLLDALVEAGANRVHGICFRIHEPERLLEEALRRAMADARHKARLLATEADVVLGDAIKIEAEEENVPGVPPVPFLRATASAMPIAPGEQELRVRVHVVYELKRAK